jgi:hypothetical protein
MAKKTPENDWKPWTFRLQRAESGLRKCRWIQALQPAVVLTALNGVQARLFNDQTTQSAEDLQNRPKTIDSITLTAVR